MLPDIGFTNPYASRDDIMTCIADRLAHALSSNDRVMVVRIDVRFPQGYPHGGKNGEISELMQRMKEYYSYHGVNFLYVWAREQNTSSVPHYHVIMFINGKNIGDGYTVWKKAAHQWGNIFEGNYGACVELCRTNEGSNQFYLQNPATMKGDRAVSVAQFETALHATLTWASYLAKTRTKGNAPYRVREYQGSRI